jgi:hypothetical protein
VVGPVVGTAAQPVTGLLSALSAPTATAAPTPAPIPAPIPAPTPTVTASPPSSVTAVSGLLGSVVGSAGRLVDGTVQVVACGSPSAAVMSANSGPGEAK